MQEFFDRGNSVTKKISTYDGKKQATPTRVVPVKQRRSEIVSLRLVIVLILVLGVLILSGVGITIARALMQGTKGQVSTAGTPVTTLPVQRTAAYAGLDVTVVNAQEARVFADDPIHAGQTTIRLNLHIANKTGNQISVVYYAIAYLLVPQESTSTPTNVRLASSFTPNTSGDGWLDYSLPKSVSLKTLTLQVGSTALNETLVNIPFTGVFNASQYADRVVTRSLSITYNYYGHTLLYHLTSVEVRFAYHGVQCTTGQRFYILDFSIDNPESGDISPGYGFDYVRFVLNGNDRTPVDNALPYTIKANAKNVKGYVVFTAPASLSSFTLGLLSQNGNPEQDTNVTLK
jgi:hypothetical protein